MSEIDELPPDQRAVVQLLLKQGKSYDELAGMLSMDAAAVRVRAHAALDALGPESGARLTPERRGEVADYLLGQQAESERESTRDYLAGSAGARSWARPVAGTLRPLAGDALPEIPAEGEEVAEAAEAEAPTAAEPAEAEAPAAAEAAAPVAEPAAPAAEPTAAPAPPPGPRRPSSRLGGALLLGGAAILVAVVLVLVISGGGGGKSKKKSDTLSSTPTQQTTNAPAPIAQVNLLPTQSGSKAVGLAQVFAQGNGRVLIIAGQGLKPGAYAIWLYSSPSKARLLGFVPNRVGKDGRFVTRGELPGDATTFSQLVVTSEQVPKNAKSLPTKPGGIVLRGRLQIS